MADINLGDIVRKLAQIKGFDELIHKAVLLYILMTDDDIAAWAKAIAVAALVYLVDPIDAIPDVIPITGYSDDLTVILAALKVLASQITDEHYRKTKSFINDL